MDIKWLKAFVTLSEELHFTAAAQRMNIAQPLFSQWIRKLEASQGVELVQRSTRSVKLTDEGKAALPFAKAAVEASRQFSRACSLEGRPLVGKVKIGYAGASTRFALPLIARAVRHALPGIELDLRAMSYSDAVPGLVEAGELDIGFGRRRPLPGSLSDRIFEYERLMVGVASDHPLASRDTIAMEELKDLPWIAFPDSHGSTLRRYSLQLAAEAGYYPEIVQEAQDSYIILDLVAAGVGVTITLSSVTGAALGGSGVKFIPLGRTPMYLAATIIHRARTTDSTDAVLELMRELLPTPNRPEGIVLEWE